MNPWVLILIHLAGAAVGVVMGYAIDFYDGLRATQRRGKGLDSGS